jgi:hypothetical protein
VTALEWVLIVVSVLVLLKVGGWRLLVVLVLGFVGFVLGVMAESAQGTPEDQR